MDVSTIASSVPVRPVVSEAPKASNAKTSDDAGGANSYQPPPLPPLPPGQGVRVDQLA
jgi:hypothetical protein